MPPKQDPLHSFEALPPEIEIQLRSLLQVRTFKAGESVFLQGETPGAIYLVASGKAKIVRVTQEGYENILCMRGPGEYFCPVPILDGGAQLGTAFAITDLTLFQINRAEFIDLCQRSPELRSIVQGDCLAEVRHLLNRLEAFAFRSVKERLIIVLLDAVRRMKERGSPSAGAPLEIRLTQQDLAGMVGASRESVSRCLQELEKTGVVKVGRGRLVIRSWRRLEELSASSSGPHFGI